MKLKKVIICFLGLTPKSENYIKHPRATVSGIQPETGSPIFVGFVFHYNI